MRKTILALAVAILVCPLLPATAQPEPPSWPSVAKQLRGDRVVPGSALERLILDNQDFQMLRKSERNDKIGIPPWLRVLWRKAHPELVYSSFDPTGGYPRVLQEVHEWLLAHQDLLPGAPDEEIAPPLDKTSVGGNVRISGLQTTPRSESDIRINYWNTTKIIGASNNISASGTQAQFYSTNSGVTWGQTYLPLQTGDAFHSDPTVDWTSNGTAWSTTIGINSTATVLKMRAYSSATDGASWVFDGTFSGTQTAADKQMIWADHSATSPYADNIYAIWHNGAPAFMNRRTGGSWGATPIQVSGAETTGTAIGGDVKTNSYGDVFGFWPATGNRRVLVTKSTNGGTSYSAPVIITTTLDSYDIGVPSFANRRALIYVSGGAYRTASKNMVYAAWTDLSGDVGCTTAANEPGTNVASTCKTRIWFSRSSNGGTTWSAPVKINHQASLNDQFNQALVVDETNGAIGIIYYDTVGDAGRKKTDVWYQTSFDDGATWGPAVKVTTAMTDETIAGADSGNQYGDYNGLSAYARVLFPSWTDRRNLLKEEIWTAQIQEPRVDVWTKDKPWDTGLEPDPATAANNMWESEDIWVRNDLTAGPHQNPEYGQINYVHVMVRNRSNTLTAINVPVYVYYANASAGLVWPTNWTLIGVAYVSSLGPLASTDVSVPWSPPGTGHYCLLSRLVTAQDPMTNAETTDVNYNTRYNNNIAWKNVNVVDLVHIHRLPVRVLLRNTDRADRTLTVHFREQKGTEDHPFLKRGTVTVDLGDELGKRWLEAGADGTGIRPIEGTTSFEVTDPDLGAIKLPVRGAEEFEIGLTFEDTVANGTADVGKPAVYFFEVVQEDPEQKELQGGVLYQIEANPLQ
jgi:hypothetical protein